MFHAYSSFSSIGSDHRIITAKIKLSLRISEEYYPSIRYEHVIIANQEAINTQLQRKPKSVINTLQHSTIIDSRKEVH